MYECIILYIHGVATEKLKGLKQSQLVHFQSFFHRLVTSSLGGLKLKLIEIIKCLNKHVFVRVIFVFTSFSDHPVYNDASGLQCMEKTGKKNSGGGGRGWFGEV